LGNADHGRAKILEAVSLSERFKKPTEMVGALLGAIVLYMYLREPGNVQEVAEGICTLASEQQVSAFVASGLVFRG
jgi:hypothetical protein